MIAEKNGCIFRPMRRILYWLKNRRADYIRSSYLLNALRVPDLHISLGLLSETQQRTRHGHVLRDSLRRDHLHLTFKRLPDAKNLDGNVIHKVVIQHLRGKVSGRDKLALERDRQTLRYL